ncbi:MAG: hypothetical protein ABII74_07395 [Elusimicrobiota bacterium]
MLNGKEGKKYDDIHDLVFSADSKQFAYTAMQSTEDVNKIDKEFVVINGKEEKKYDGVSLLTFSSDSKQFAYVATEGSFSAGEIKNFIILNGQEGNKHDYIYSLAFSPDSKYLCYGAMDYGVRDGGYLWWIVEEVDKFGKK